LEKCKITSDDESVRLFLELRAISQLKIPYQFISLQDAVDLCLLLEEVTVQLMKYTTDVRGVGGPIDVATITRVEGFNYVQHKEIHGERVSR
jgi:hypothetical protein